eukprot:CAMPEP_0198591432 /NCGR_PEP_ID=MMETSP1462-20131121/136882_2 /TAXON_ID=1333877 /ORGANISM="Brandtodinium nutriculum, Strain RCC3387" /LENGTH=41 /DNA_ID= /DNA_START= /DNA_END= /DNA_ORIENTATION=
MPTLGLWRHAVKKPASSSSNTSQAEGRTSASQTTMRSTSCR